MHQHVTASAPVSASHIPGTTNLFADISSCSFKMFFQAPWSAFLIHTDANFILAFNSPFSGHNLEHCFPHAKHGIHCDLLAVPAVIANGPGMLGPITPLLLALTLSSLTPPILPPNRSYWPLQLTTKLGLMAKGVKLGVAPLRPPFTLPPNISSWLATLTLNDLMRQKNLISLPAPPQNIYGC